MDGNTSKCCLKNIIMYVDGLKMECRSNRLLITWNVPGFFERPVSNLYTSHVEGPNFDLQLKKHRNSFDVIVDTKNFDRFKKISCKVSLTDEDTSDSIDAVKTPTDLYEVRCPSNVFRTLYRCALEHNSAIQLQFDMHLKDERFSYTGKLTSDCSKCTELKDFVDSVKEKETYFVIKSLSETKFYCPKSLLAARSKYFRNYFNNPNNNQDEKKLHFTDTPINTVINYLYSGILQVFDLKLMLDIYQLACEHDISSLKIRCFREFSTLVNSSSKHQRERAVEGRNLKFLEDAAAELFERREEK